MKMTRAVIAGLSLVVVGAPSSVFAGSPEEGAPQRVPGFVMVDGVNARNGNFSLTYPAFGKGRGVPYRRTYNSRAVNHGIFGYGWGSTFDTSLVVLDDAHAVVVENGNGALTAYGVWPASVEVETVEARVAEALARRGAHRRNGLGSIFSTIQRWLKPQEAPTRLRVSRRGALTSEVCDEAVLVRAGSTWTRTRCDGTIQTYRLDGRLISYTTPGETRPVLLRWNGDRLGMVRNVDGQMLSLVYADGLVRVMDQSRGWITYSLDARGRNIEVLETDAAPLIFTYDDRSNLTRTAFIDTTHRDIAYDDQNRTTLIARRNGEKTTFTYGQDESGRPQTQVRQVTREGVSTVKTYVFD